RVQQVHVEGDGCAAPLLQRQWRGRADHVDRPARFRSISRGARGQPRQADGAARRACVTDRLIILDGHSLMHRGFHAVRPLTSPSGHLTNAVFGFTSMLLKACGELQPRYAVAAFDTSAPTFRHLESSNYKATRGPTADGLHEQF